MEPSGLTSVDVVVVFVYFASILGLGSLFGRHTRSTHDFFFAGQRFPWWLIAVSLVASAVGSYSFIKYAKKGYEYGLSSSYTYVNDVPWLPLFILVWLPLIYFGRIGSVPEYMERRFGTATRLASTLILLIYMVGYVGFNLYTIGVGVEGIVGVAPVTTAVVVGVVCAVYVTAGGQTSVVMTDLVQGVILLVAGCSLLVIGAATVGGWGELWHLWGPVDGGVEQRLGLPPFNQPRDFNFVGIFWQDGVANNLASMLINQGMILRFLCARTVRDGQRAALVMTVLLMPLAAVAVSGAGWVGSALHRSGLLVEVDSSQIFVVVADLLCGPGMFGLMMAALLAALMSTADTLINATAAVWVNDVWRPYVAPGQSDRYYLRVARWGSIVTALVGILFVPLFMRFDLYEAHGAFTACVTPPLAVALLLGLACPRAGEASALASLLGGSLGVALTLVFPSLLVPVSLLVGGGPEPSNYLRAAFGLGISSLLGLGTALVTRPPSPALLDGLTAFSLRKASWRYKGGRPKAPSKRSVLARLMQDGALDGAVGRSFARARVSRELAVRLGVEPGDLVFVAHRNPLVALVKATHAQVVAVSGRGVTITLHPDALAASGLSVGETVAVALEM